MTKTTATTLNEAKAIAAPMFDDAAVASVDVQTWIGDLRIFRDGTIKVTADCE